MIFVEKEIYSKRIKIKSSKISEIALEALKGEQNYLIYHVWRKLKWPDTRKRQGSNAAARRSIDEEQMKELHAMIDLSPKFFVTKAIGT